MTKINPHNKCPECGYEVDDASEVGGSGDRPEPGDLALCIRCAGPGFYELDGLGMLSLRLATVEEKVKLSQDEEVQAVRERIEAMSGWFTP